MQESQKTPQGIAEEWHSKAIVRIARARDGLLVYADGQRVQISEDLVRSALLLIEPDFLPGHLEGQIGSITQSEIPA